MYINIRKTKKWIKLQLHIQIRTILILGLPSESHHCTLSSCLLRTFLLLYITKDPCVWAE